MGCIVVSKEYASISNSHNPLIPKDVSAGKTINSTAVDKLSYSMYTRM